MNIGENVRGWTTKTFCSRTLCIMYVHALRMLKNVHGTGFDIFGCGVRITRCHSKERSKVFTIGYTNTSPNKRTNTKIEGQAIEWTQKGVRYDCRDDDQYVDIIIKIKKIKDDTTGTEEDRT